MSDLALITTVTAFDAESSVEKPKLAIMHSSLGDIVEHLRVEASVRKVAMKVRAFVCLGAMIPLPLAMSQQCAAQLAIQNGSAPHIIVSKLSAPIYPPLARVARIAGDVTLSLSIRADGSIESVTTVNGHPMLAQAALDSAKQSSFECRGCQVGSNVSGIVTYSFKMSAQEPHPCCCSSASVKGKPAPVLQVSESGDHVVLTDAPGCICPDRCTSAWAFEHARFRSRSVFSCGNAGFTITAFTDDRIPRVASR